jgi:hypothetical protein
MVVQPLRNGGQPLEWWFRVPYKWWFRITTRIGLPATRMVGGSALEIVVQQATNCVFTSPNGAAGALEWGGSGTGNCVCGLPLEMVVQATRNRWFSH